jgi:Methyltransferase domain
MAGSDTEKGGGTAPILAGYSSGRYAKEHTGDDDGFKARAFLSLFDRVAKVYGLDPGSYIDVGCLGGGVVEAVANGLRRRGHSLSTVKGYDVSPMAKTFVRPGIEFVQGDFTASEERVDLVTLFDVLEHVLRPVEFVRAIAERCKYIGLHIPLDDSIANGIFNRFGSRLNYPGHLIYLNPASALSLMAHCGLRVVDYEYTHGFQAPSGSLTRKQRAIKPFRAVVAMANPWVASRLVGGVSLMVLCATERGLGTVPAFANLGLDVTAYLKGR